MTVHLLPQALEDLEAFYEPLRTEIVERLEVLVEFPSAGVPMTQEFTGYRCFILSPLVRVIYTIRNKRILIAYIRHTARKK